MPKSAEELFASALELTNTADRAALLDRECTGNPALRAEVESLLAAHEQASEFLENPPGAAAADTMAATGTRPVTEKPGDKICRYKLLKRSARAVAASCTWRSKRNRSTDALPSRSS